MLGFTKEQVIEAIKGSFGIMSTIAKRLNGCSWHAAERHVNRWAETRQAYAAENERSLDLSESKLLEAVSNGDGQMIRFHLATKGKGRGYTEKHEQLQTIRLKVEYERDDPDGQTAEVSPGAAKGAD